MASIRAAGDWLLALVDKLEDIVDQATFTRIEICISTVSGGQDLPDIIERVIERWGTVQGIVEAIWDPDDIPEGMARPSWLGEKVYLPPSLTLAQHPISLLIYSACPALFFHTSSISCPRLQPLIGRSGAAADRKGGVAV